MFIQLPKTPPYNRVCNFNINFCFRWVQGAPVGTQSTIDTPDGPKPSIIIPDPRIPQGWSKHVFRKSQGPTAVKWEVVIFR